MARWVEEQKTFLESYLARTQSAAGKSVPPVSETQNYVGLMRNADLFMERHGPHPPRCTYYRYEPVPGKSRYHWESSEDYRYDGMHLDRSGLHVVLLPMNGNGKKKQRMVIVPRMHLAHSFIDEHYTDHHHKGLYLRQPGLQPVHHFFMLHR